MITHSDNTIAISDIDPFSADFLTDPYPGQELLRETAPVVWLERYEVFAMARHEHVSSALRDAETFCSSAGVGLADFRREKPWRPLSLLLEADPPEHSRARRVITKVLTPAVVRSLQEGFSASARELVENVLAADSIESIRDIAEAFPLKVFPDAIGLPPDERRNLLVYGRMVNNGFGPHNEFFEKAMRDASGVRDWVMAHCEIDVMTPGGLGWQVHQIAREEGFTPEESAMIVRSLLSAGVETTVNAIANALLCFATYPDQWKRLRQNPGSARAAFEEVIRYESPVQVFFRTTTCETSVAGSTIPPGQKVLLMLGAANRDPRAWSNPDHFNIQRRAAGHVGFGMGIHACVGQMLARLEGEALLTALAHRVTELELDGSPVRLLNNTLRGLEKLPLKLHVAHN